MSLETVLAKVQHAQDAFAVQLRWELEDAPRGSQRERELIEMGQEFLDSTSGEFSVKQERQRDIEIARAHLNRTYQRYMPVLARNGYGVFSSEIAQELAKDPALTSLASLQRFEEALGRTLLDCGVRV